MQIRSSLRGQILTTFIFIFGSHIGLYNVRCQLVGQLALIFTNDDDDGDDNDDDED